MFILSVLRLERNLVAFRSHASSFCFLFELFLFWVSSFLFWLAFLAEYGMHGMVPGLRRGLLTAADCAFVVGWKKWKKLLSRNHWLTIGGCVTLTSLAALSYVFSIRLRQLFTRLDLILI